MQRNLQHWGAPIVFVAGIAPIFTGGCAVAQKSDVRAMINNEYRLMRRTVPRAEANQTYLGFNLWWIKGSDSSRGLDLDDERVSLSGPLQAGQKIRMTIESARAGYLYVIERERNEDGSMGVGTLIFPDRRIRDGKNWIERAKPVEVPEHSAFRVSRSSSRHVAEVITVIVAPSPIEGMMAPKQVPLDQLEKWEKQWGSEARIQKVENNGGPASPSQQERRSLEGKAVLGPGDPLPQTIFRFQTPPNQAVLTSVSFTMAGPE